MIVKKKKFSLLLWFVIVLALAACQKPGGNVTPTVPDEEILPTATNVPTVTPQPTETPAPEAIFLYVPADVPAEEATQAQASLSSWAGENGFLFEVKTTLSDADVTDNCVVLVMLNENGVDVNAFAQQHPETTFVVTRDSSAADQPANVITFVADPNALNFAAGFVSILIAPDWRLGALLPWDDEVTGAEAQEAFMNGSAYHCGRCASVYMPVALFPVMNSLPSGSSPETWINAITTLDNQYYLYTVYVAPEAASEQLYQYLVTQNVTVVGAKKPEGIEGLLWAASINQDAFGALMGNWDAIINGTLAENEILVPVVLSEVNEEYLSPGRMRVYDEMMDALLGEWISPLSPEYP